MEDSGGLKDGEISEKFLEEFNVFLQLFFEAYYVLYADNTVESIAENILMELIVSFKLEIK